MTGGAAAQAKRRPLALLLLVVSGGIVGAAGFFAGTTAHAASAFQYGRPPAAAADRIGPARRRTTWRGGREQAPVAPLRAKKVNQGLLDDWNAAPPPPETILGALGGARSTGASGDSRRLFLASVLIGTAGLLAPEDSRADASAASVSASASSSAFDPWTANPINKRSGITVSDAERAGYSVAFVTYLSRFLLNFDPNCQRWWFSTGRIPRNASPAEVEAIRINQFGSFSASVEVGLQGFSEGEDGPSRLLRDLRDRYGCGDEIAYATPGGTPAIEEKRRVARSIRRQIALLFGLLEERQPVEDITRLLASVDNGCVSSVSLMNDTGTFSGFEASRPPVVVLPPPEAGENYLAAEGRAILTPTGRILRLDVVDPGSGYAAPPVVSITGNGGWGVQAKARARTATKGPKKGSLDTVQVTDPGFGYILEGDVEVRVTPPDSRNGRQAVLNAVLDMRIDGVKITRGGTGYAAEKPLKVFVEPPPSWPSAVTAGTAAAATADVSKDRVQVGVAYATAEQTSFTTFRRESEAKKIRDLEDEFEAKYNMQQQPPPLAASTVSGVDGDLPPLPFWAGGKSTSAELLRLLPAGIGLEYDASLKRYVLAADTTLLSQYPAALEAQQLSRDDRPSLGLVEYGPRGRAPIERDMHLGPSQYVRFALSGAVCCAAVHVALTPLDVVKVKVQVDPVRYPSIRSSLGTVWNEEGPATLFTGWIPTLTGQFVGGGVLYAVTEFGRRTLSEMAGADAMALEVPIILLAAAFSASLNAVLICPFEAVKIRTIAQPEYAPNSVGVLDRMLEEEGVPSLFNAVPVFLARNIPYAMVKFLVFDLSTEWLYESFPAAQEDLKLSLLVSLVGGVLGGTSAAVVSNPADAVISEMKKAEGDMGPFEAAAIMTKRAGLSSFFIGLPVRMVFYSLIGSMIFVSYDAVRFLLGVGSQDLKLYLDVLGGALNDGPLV